MFEIIFWGTMFMLFVFPIIATTLDLIDTIRTKTITKHFLEDYFLIVIPLLIVDIIVILAII